VSHPLSGASIKRIAWAFGCAKKDSDEEAALYRLLLERCDGLLASRRFATNNFSATMREARAELTAQGVVVDARAILAEDNEP